jgi:hypothetical protein
MWLSLPLQLAIPSPVDTAIKAPDLPIVTPTCPDWRPCKLQPR